MTQDWNRRGTPRVAAALAALVCIGLAGCSSTSEKRVASVPDHINTKTKFSVAEYGVAASPRVTMSKNVKKGGGRDMVGKPYRVRGKWYTPKEEPGYNKAGLASWYGPNFHGRLTANGEIYDQFHLSAAHPTFPLPSYARVTNKKNGHSVMVRVNDRGPYAHGRIIDVSKKAAELLDMKNDGVAAVRVEYVGRAPVDGDDTPFLMASYRPAGGVAPQIQDAYGSGNVMLAMNETVRPPAGLPGVTNGVNGQAAPQMAVAAAMPRPEIAPLSAAQVVPAAQPVAFQAGDQPLPAGFALPDIGPVPGDRPSLIAPIAMSTPAGMTDVGLAYRGARVAPAAMAFDAILVVSDKI
jgi:rare lipoprotein A